jgi:hypothetical protein
MFKKLLSAGSIGEVLAIILLFAFGIANSTNLPGTGRQTEKKDLSIQKYFQKANYSSYQKLVNSNIFESDVLVASDSIKTTPTEDVYAFKGKSLKRGFIYSLILPGAGEFYANSKIKAGVFLGLEALFWTGYFTYHNKGVTKRNEYRAFANQHWSSQAYEESLLTIYGVDLDTIESGTKLPPKVGWEDTLVVGEKLPSSRTQQYYEMIGKYDQFRFGWDDYDPEKFLTANRSLYLDMRSKYNKFFDRAKYAMMGSLANRILSAFDAAISVKGYNRKGEGFSSIQMKMRMVEYNDGLIPTVSLNMRF